jgi:hypothetical protein
MPSSANCLARTVYSNTVVLPRLSIFRLRTKSLLRGILLSLGALVAALRLEGFPSTADLHASPWQFLAVPIACWGMVETARCLRRKWNLYHAGVIILLYSELMILALALFFWLYHS